LIVYVGVNDNMQQAGSSLNRAPTLKQ